MKGLWKEPPFMRLIAGHPLLCYKHFYTNILFKRESSGRRKNDIFDLYFSLQDRGTFHEILLSFI